METLALTGAVLAVLGALFALLGARFARDGRAFDRGAARAHGEITGVQWRAIGAAGGRSMTGFPVLRFTLPDGRVVVTVSRTGTTFDVADEGRAVSVLYDPAAPERARVDCAGSAAASPVVGAVLMAIGGAAVLTGLVMLALGISLHDALPAVIHP